MLSVAVLNRYRRFGAEAVPPDETAPSGYAIAFDAGSYTEGVDDDAVSLDVTSAEVGASWALTISSSGGGTDVTDSGTVASASFTISGQDLTGLNPGTLTASLVLTDAALNEGSPATDTATLSAAGLSEVEYLVIAGGGGGQSFAGGGAGGYRTGTKSVTLGTPYTITVGAGGAASVSTASPGGNSVFDDITSIGGGGAAYGTGGSGGSGAGARGTGGAGTVGQGNNGGNGYDSGGSNASGGGGGGAGGAGTNGTVSVAGNGGAGLSSSITGSAVTRAAGGRGIKWISSVQTNGTSGPGRGSANLGGGGDAGNPTGRTAGDSGVVIIRYPDSYPAAASTTGSPTVTNPTGYRVYTFTASGSITF